MSEAIRTQVALELARHQTRLRAFVRCLLIRPRDIDDLLQEVNAVVWQKADEFQPGTDFWAWASQIARLKALNQLRAYTRNRLVFDEAVLSRLAQVADDRLEALDSRREALDHCLSQLPAAQRQLIELRYTGEQAIESISESLGRPAGSIRQTLYRIRAALVNCVERRLSTAKGNE